MSTFLDRLAGVAQEPLFLDPADREREQRENTWWLTTDEAEHAHLDVTTLAAVLAELAGRLAERAVAQLAAAPVTFYAWYEELARQLRCSTGSCAPSELPFPSRVVPVTAETVAAAFFGEKKPGDREHAVAAWVVPLI
ncbi:MULTISPECIES: hypothetical protein [unclassified Crossiella]|uniref:hypothetical protein n=1 Tax=unclassified Crossiella TaxID=2620835 RepID=UPI001FFEBB22|nr:MULTISPECIES: hypothetical protein [unclassified Crossiella]MCK2245368.1 hypothetical protein [Crossiella sp. S99.2]MCK2259045.1 hypothetical protein [Crossiella sp. S99.1]